MVDHKKADDDTPEEDLVKPSQVKRLQARNLWVALSSILVLGILYCMVSSEKAHHSSKSSTVQFSSPLNRQDIDSAWLEQFQTKAKAEGLQLAHLQQRVHTLINQKAVIKQQKLNQNLLKKDHQLTQSLQALEKRIQQMKQSESTQPMSLNRSVQSTVSGTQFPRIPAQSYSFSSLNKSIPGLAINGEDQLSLITPHLDQNTLSKTAKDYVPSGTHVLGILLMGADLVADQSDQNNPKPILIRLITNGSLPNHKHSHLKNCIITAAMRGDISSMRGNVRLERLSCDLAGHGILDVAVNGTVATHAKEGIAGQLYSAEGSRITSTVFAGGLAGIAKGISQGYVQQQKNIFGSTSSIHQGDLFKYGSLQGMGNGLNQLSHFEMHRADQIHPIIQVNGGKLVTVVFTHGFYLDQPSSRSANTTVVMTQPAPLATSAQMVSALLQTNPQQTVTNNNQ